MTFISAVTSPRFVLVSCDLRVTTSKASRVVDQTDWAMKATLLDSDEVLAFAGLARLGSQLTDQWLGEVLAGVSATTRLETLAAAATTEFRRLKLLEPHAFLGAGFHDYRAKRVPHAWMITNSWNDEESRFGPWSLDSEFQVQMLEIPRDHLTSLWAVGGEDENAEPRHDLLNAARHSIEEIVKRDAADPRPIMHRLAQLNRDMSSTGDHIGASAVVTSLPRHAQPNAGLVFWMSPIAASIPPWRVSLSVFVGFHTTAMSSAMSLTTPL